MARDNVYERTRFGRQLILGGINRVHVCRLIPIRQNGTEFAFVYRFLNAPLRT